ncbi:hypothetical protein GO308_08965 [Sphingomonas sp. SFZ2018-12]|uniref:hypothetical protein n=1 Tax=Sphingomonas sp. SFZ2018-12 TaxID=2683197 RepID=UPI001F113A00|nr:hypothetical protein [Sphingomonas sp. SFZ2018-12]MCH4893235.1 hypothetical protein [Sphingomonas sp. SFZ2018-12]
MVFKKPVSQEVRMRLYPLTLLALPLILSAAEAQTPASRTISARERPPVHVRVDQQMATGLRAGFKGDLSLNPYWLIDREGVPHILEQDGVARIIATLAPAAMRSSGHSPTIRIGGIGSELTFWTSTGEPNPDWSQGRLTPRSMAALATLVRRTGYRVILTVNLGQYRRGNQSPERAADMVHHAKLALGESLAAVAIGNEPSLEPFTYDRNHDRSYQPDEIDLYWQDWNLFRSAILERVPGMRFYGPSDFAIDDHNNIKPTIYEGFVERQAALRDATGVASVDTLTYHHYTATACENAEQATIPILLSSVQRERTRRVARRLHTDAARLGVPAAFDERNSASCAGKAGVSNTMASALWALDAILLNVQEGIVGQNFHAMLGRCGDEKPRYGWYTPFCGATDADAVAGKLIAQPIFYGMLAARLVPDGRYLAVTHSGPETLRIFAVREGQDAGARLSIVVINVADPAPRPAEDIVIDLGSTYMAASSVTLQVAGKDGLRATSQVRLGGGEVDAKGQLNGMKWLPLSLSGNSLSLSVAGATAQVIRIE